MDSAETTKHLASMDSAETTTRRDEKHLGFVIWCDLYKKFDDSQTNESDDIGWHQWRHD